MYGILRQGEFLNQTASYVEAIFLIPIPYLAYGENDDGKNTDLLWEYYGKY